MTFFCNRDVKEGDELCIRCACTRACLSLLSSPADDVASRRRGSYSSRGEERKAFLYKHYGFFCECRFCKSNTDPRSAHEVRCRGVAGPRAECSKKHCGRCGCEIWTGLCVVCDADKIAEALAE